MTAEPGSLTFLRGSDAAFFDVAPDMLARRLLSLVLVSHIGGETTGGVIVEVEAYLASGDAAAHSARPRSAAKATLFGPAGRLYIHPMRQRCGVDIVAHGGSVLIRALEPNLGLDIMANRRGTADLRRLASGPARLCEALGLTRALDGQPVLAAGSPVRLARTGRASDDADIKTTARIGLTRAVDLPLRFYLPGSRFLSRPERPAQKNA